MADSKQLEDLFLYDELFSLVTVDEVAQAWCRYQARVHLPGVDDEDPDRWAVDLLMDTRFLSDEPRVRAVLDLLVEGAGEEVLGVVGAGPLEDFVKGCDEDRLVWIEERAAASSRFRQALAGVWIWRLSPEVFARVERAAGVPLRRPTERREIDFVPGELPGTIHVTLDGVPVSELEAEPEDVVAMIELLRRHSGKQRHRPD